MKNTLVSDLYKVQEKDKDSYKTAMPAENIVNQTYVNHTFATQLTK